MKSLGRKPEGARLERIKAAPLWAGERFRNVHPIVAGLRDPSASMPTISEFLCGGDRRRNPGVRIAGEEDRAHVGLQGICA